MTDAQLTVQHAVFNGIIDQWHRKNDPKFAEIVRDKVIESLFAPHILWAVEEYAKELKGVDLSL